MSLPDNQPPALIDYNLYDADAALQEAVVRQGAGWAHGRLRELGGIAGGEEALRWASEANRCGPVLQTHDRFGNRLDEVDFHPSWHRLMETAVAFGLHAAPWREPRCGVHVARGAMFFLWSQVEAGHSCPISMTHAAIPALRLQPDVSAAWEPHLAASSYDPRLRSRAQKESALCGMAVTERQGGSDVRANTTRAQPCSASGPGRPYLIVGKKWFCSAPMSDAFLVLAQAPGGVSCFLLPRVLDDGTKNAFAIQRLKDKLGNRSNASSEVEFHEAWAVLVGEEGRGIQTIAEMINHTRLDCIIGTAAAMRQAVVQAAHHAAHRRAFGRKLDEHPLMRNVLADLALESEAATALFVRLASACDRATQEEPEALIKRLGTAIGKYWVCKRGPSHVAEALECLGGNGYVEESILPRLYREVPLNSIWEGCGNVNALDVMRVIAKEPAAVEALFAEVAVAAGADRRLDAAAGRLRRELEDPVDAESRARRIVEQLALVFQGALLVRHGIPAVADAYCASRLGGDWGRSFGTLPLGLDLHPIIGRARPTGV